MYSTKAHKTKPSTMVKHIDKLRALKKKEAAERAAKRKASKAAYSARVKAARQEEAAAREAARQKEAAALKAAQQALEAAQQEEAAALEAARQQEAAALEAARQQESAARDAARKKQAEEILLGRIQAFNRFVEQHMLAHGPWQEGENAWKHALSCIGGTRLGPKYARNTTWSGGVATALKDAIEVGKLCCDRNHYVWAEGLYEKAISLACASAYNDRWTVDTCAEQRELLGSLLQQWSHLRVLAGNYAEAVDDAGDAIIVLPREMKGMAYRQRALACKAWGKTTEALASQYNALYLSGRVIVNEDYLFDLDPPDPDFDPADPFKIELEQTKHELFDRFAVEGESNKKVFMVGGGNEIDMVAMSRSYEKESNMRDPLKTMSHTKLTARKWSAWEELDGVLNELNETKEVLFIMPLDDLSNLRKELSWEHFSRFLDQLDKRGSKLYGGGVWETPAPSIWQRSYWSVDHEGMPLDRLDPFQQWIKLFGLMRPGEKKSWESCLEEHGGHDFRKVYEFKKLLWDTEFRRGRTEKMQMHPFIKSYEVNVLGVSTSMPAVPAGIDGLTWSRTKGNDKVRERFKRGLGDNYPYKPPPDGMFSILDNHKKEWVYTPKLPLREIERRRRKRLPWRDYKKY